MPLNSFSSYAKSTFDFAYIYEKIGMRWLTVRLTDFISTLQVIAIKIVISKF